MSWYGDSNNIVQMGQAQMAAQRPNFRGAAFQPRLGMQGTSIPVPRASTPQGQYSIQAAMQKAAMGNGTVGMTPRTAPQQAYGPDGGGVNPGQMQMPPPVEMSQQERERQGANYGPQNAALAGYMMG